MKGQLKLRRENYEEVEMDYQKDELISNFLEVYSLLGSIYNLVAINNIKEDFCAAVALNMQLQH